MRPWFCGCLSLIIPGAGQFYTGRISKGLLFLFLSIGTGVAKDYMLGTTRFLGLLPAVGFLIFGILVSIVAIWDAVCFAKRQQALPKETPDPVVWGVSLAYPWPVWLYLFAKMALLRLVAGSCCFRRFVY